jgi:hypothetical protein
MADKRGPIISGGRPGTRDCHNHVGLGCQQNRREREIFLASGPRAREFGPPRFVSFFSFLFSISFKFSNLYSKFQMYSNLNFNFLSAKISPNINFTVYNIIIIIIDSFPYYLFMGETNDFIKIPFLNFFFTFSFKILRSNPNYVFNEMT